MSVIKRVISLIFIICFLITFESINVDTAYAKSQGSKFKIVLTSRDRIIALKTDGTLWEWYYPKAGSLNLKNIKFQQIKGLSNIKSVAANEYFCMVLKNDGTVWSWGKNEYGQLGDGTNIKRNKPVQVKNVSKIKEIAIHWHHAMALKDDGTIWVWGEAGYGTRTANGFIYSPVKVKELSKVYFSRRKIFCCA